MELLLGCPISDWLVERMSGFLVCEREPYLLDAETRRLLPPTTPVLSRQELFADFQRCPLEVRDSYELYSVTRDAQWAALLSPHELQALPPGIRSAILRLQWELGRGQIYQEEIISELLPADEQRLAREYLFPTPEGKRLALRHDLWRHLSFGTRRRWLLRYLAWRNEDCKPYLVSENEWTRITRRLGPAVRRLAFTFPTKAGPNCLATAIAPLTPDLAMAESTSELWLWQEPFLKRLEAHGLARQGGPVHPQTAPAGSVLVWEDSAGQVQHACHLLGDGLALNKNSQSWHSPRLIWQVDELLACWENDGFNLALYTPNQTRD